MYKSFKKVLSFTITGVGIFINTTIPALAANVKFELSFFDDNNAQVGSGKFSYDDEISTCFETSFGGDCNQSDEYFQYDTIFVENALTDFSATIDGFDWDGSYGHWWSDEESGQLPGEQSVSRSDIAIRYNNWFFGDPYFGEESLIMDFNKSSNTFGEGSWSQELLLESGNPPIMGSGTWQAIIVQSETSPTKTVPESATLPSILIVFGLAYYSQRKK